MTEQSAQDVSYHVLDEHTLGYVDRRFPHLFGVLQGSVLLGGRSWKNGPVFLCPSHVLRPATLDDFERFRVRPEGHIAPLSSPSLAIS